MKKLIATMMTVCVLSNSMAFAADCKWSTGITPQGTGYLYTPECHAKVGLTLRDNDDFKIQVDALRKTIDTQKLIIEKADERTILWRNESYEQFDRLQKQAQYSQTNNVLWFVLGIVVTSAAVYGAGQLK
jgi:hypothetical protein